MNLYVARVLLPTGITVWWMWDANRLIKGWQLDNLYDLLCRWRQECGSHSNVVIRFDGGPFETGQAEALVRDSRPLPKITVATVHP